VPIFGWGKKDESTKKDAAGASGTAEAADPKAAAGKDTKSGGLDLDPAKADKWFSYAKKVADQNNIEYSLTCLVLGLRSAPDRLDAVKDFFATADRLRATGGTTLSQEARDSIKGSTVIDKYLRALVEWALKPKEPEVAVRAAIAPTELGLIEVSRWIAPKALGVVASAERPRKDQAIRLMETFQKIEDYENALNAGQLAVRIDPGDARLAKDVRDLSAQAAMTRGGFDQTGKEGGFRSNIRDADKQRLLDETDRSVKSEEIADRVIAGLKAELAANPMDKPTIRKLLKELVGRGTPASEQEAIDLAEASFKTTQEFSFRSFAGEVRVRQAKREGKRREAALAATPDDASLAQQLADAESRRNALEKAELEARVAAYPTDLGLKFELGKVLQAMGQHEEAISLLQLAKNDPKHRNAVALALGESFLAVGWFDEAVQTFRNALEAVADPNEGLGLDLRYALCVALQKRAEDARDLASAEEAYKLASAIAIQNISYRDVRTRRDQLKVLSMQLRSNE